MEQILRKIGLKDNEIKIYKTLLKLGEATASEILMESGLNTGKIYEDLNSLDKKGLISTTIKSNVKHFIPADPHKLLFYIDEEKKKLEKQKLDFEKVLPELLKNINNSKKKTKIEVFSGIKGLKTAHLKEFDYAKSGSTLYVNGILSATDSPKDVYDFFIYNIIPKREKSKYKIKKILDVEARKNRKDHEKKAEIRYLPYGSQMTITVIENLTLIDINSKSPVTIAVESEEIAESFIKQFEYLWNIAKK